MKKILLTSALAFFCIQPLTSIASEAREPLDQIVAIVNDDVITRSELNESLNMVKMQMGNNGDTSHDALKKQALDILINKKIQLQIAKQAGITISDSDLKRAITYIAKQNNMTVDQLFERIAQDGLSVKAYKEEMRDQITVQKLQQEAIVSRVTVSPDEISAFLHSAIWQDTRQKEYRLQDVLIPLPDNAGTAAIHDAKQKAQAIISDLKQAKTIKENTSDYQATDLGWRKPDEIPSLFSKQLSTMQKNDISEPIEAPNGIHVIRLTDVRAVGSQLQAMPTRKQAEDILLQRKYAEAIQTWVSKQRGQAFIKTNFDV